jgi:hypothetical protein
MQGKTVRLVYLWMKNEHENSLRHRPDLAQLDTGTLDTEYFLTDALGSAEGPTNRLNRRRHLCADV